MLSYVPFVISVYCAGQYYWVSFLYVFNKKKIKSEMMCLTKN